MKRKPCQVRASLLTYQNQRHREKISQFPKIYYHMKNGLIMVTVEIMQSRYQDQLLRLEKKLESGIYCEFVDKELQNSFIKYTLLFDAQPMKI